MITSTHDVHKSGECTLVVSSHGLPYLLALLEWMAGATYPHCFDFQAVGIWTKLCICDLGHLVRPD